MTSSIDLILLPRARKDVRDILQYTYDTWGSDQRDTYREILERAYERIRAFPEIGHPASGRTSNIREYHIEHHIIYYRRETDAVIILRIVSPKRRRP